MVAGRDVMAPGPESNPYTTLSESHLEALRAKYVSELRSKQLRFYVNLPSAIMLALCFSGLVWAFWSLSTLGIRGSSPLGPWTVYILAAGVLSSSYWIDKVRSRLRYEIADYKEELDHLNRELARRVRLARFVGAP